MKCSRLPASARSATTWWVQFGSRLHSAGTSSRLQVMMRQPSSLNLCTVAWPMPRLAPVRITVLLWSDMGVSVAEPRATATPGRPLSMRHQERYGRRREHVPRRAAQDHLAQAAVAIGTHHQQVGLGAAGVTQERGAGPAMFGGQGLMHRPNAVLAEIADEIGGRRA